MNEIVNLRIVKKARARAAAKLAAKENRIRHGRAGAEKTNDARQAARREADLDGTKRPPDHAAEHRKQ